MKKGCINRIVGLVPGYGWACFLILAACQALVFCATRIPLQYMDKLDLSIPLDGRIPFRPEWITIYVLSFASWAITFFLLFRQRREHVYRNSAAYLCTLMLTFACFMLFPAELQRPEVPGTDFFSWPATTAGGPFGTRRASPSGTGGSISCSCYWSAPPYCW